MQADATVKSPVIKQEGPKQEGPLKCQFCDYGAEKTSNLKNHTLNHFKDVLFPLLPKRIPFLCPECNAPHRDKITLLRHFSWSHQMFYRFGSKEDLVPRPQDQPIRDPKSAKPSNVTTEPYVPKVFSVPSQPADPLETKPNIVKKDPLEAKANLQQRLARVSEQFATNSKKDPLETNNDSKKDPLATTNDSEKDPLETNNASKKDPPLEKNNSIKVVFAPPAAAKPNVQSILKPTIVMATKPIQKQPIVVQKPSSQPIQQKPIVVPKPSFHLPLPKGFEHLGAKPENSEQKNGIGFAGSVSDNHQEKVRMLEARMTKKESPSEVDNSKT